MTQDKMVEIRKRISKILERDYGIAMTDAVASLSDLIEESV